MLDIPSWVPHDLRRTVCTGLSRLQCPNEVAEVILGHTKGGELKGFTISIYMMQSASNGYRSGQTIWIVWLSVDLHNVGTSNQAYCSGYVSPCVPKWYLF